MDSLEQKPSVIIFSSRGGGGHMAASQAIKEALSSDYRVQIYNALSDVFFQIDLVSKITKNRYTAEDVYNFFLRKRLFIMANFYGIAGQVYVFFNKSLLIKAVKAFLKTKKPALVISVIPFFNGPIQVACQQLKIPFWIIPTDVELKTFLIGLQKHRDVIPSFKMALAYLPQIQQAQDWGLCEPHILKVGFPVKSACVRAYSQEDLNQLKAQFQIQTTSKVITLTLGAAGTCLFIKFLKVIMALPYSDLEILGCAGRDQVSFRKTRRYLETMGVCEYEDAERVIFRLSNGNRLHLWGFTQHLSQIMAVSDLVVSKSGSLSVSEALYLKKYLLVDHTLNSSSRFLFWERANLPFIKSINNGEGFFSCKDLTKKIEEFLAKPKGCLEDRFLNIHQTLLEAVNKEVGYSDFVT